MSAQEASKILEHRSPGMVTSAKAFGLADAGSGEHGLTCRCVMRRAPRRRRRGHVDDAGSVEPGLHREPQQ